jgi:hypothetical protein
LSLLTFLMKRAIPAAASASLSSSTTTSESFERCHQWLQHHQTRGLDKVQFQSSESCGQSYGCYAKQDYQIGDIIFEIPQQECLYGFQNTFDTILSKIILRAVEKRSLERILSSELILWLHMIEQRAIESLPFYSYFSSLSPLSPTIDNWSPVEYHVLLEGTNLASSLLNDPLDDNAFFDLLEQIWFFYQEEISPPHCDENIFTVSALRWARGQYLSRRYPERFLPLENEAQTFRESLPSHHELYGKMGVMVPLLDILNHNHQQEWLQMKIENGKLQIICNYPVERVSSPLLPSTLLPP